MDNTTQSRAHRFRLTPGHCLLALLAVEFLLFLSQWFRWLPKGWPVLIAIASVVVVILAMFVWFGVAVMFRRRFQFSLRSLLVLVVVVALPCSWLAVSIRDAKTQRDAVHAIKVSGGEVCLAFYDDRTHTAYGYYGPGMANQPPSGLLPDWTFDFFYPMSNVSFTRTYQDSFPILELDAAVVSPELAMQAARLPHLHYLSFAGTNAGDACLEPLRNLQELVELDLRCSQVTEAGVAKLREAIPSTEIYWGWDNVFYGRGCPTIVYYAPAREGRVTPSEHELKILKLQISPATAGDMGHLKDFPELEKLELRGNIKDGSLEHLKGMVQLRTLDLTETQVTAAGVAKLQQALPNCKITR